jgi:hypothetical protein
MLKEAIGRTKGAHGMRKLDQVVTFLLLTVVLVVTLGVAPAPAHPNGTISYTFPPNDVVYPEGI